MDHTLTIDTLGDLDDGIVRRLADRALGEALTDCDARPMLNKPRKVVITIEMRPVVEDRGAMKGVNTAVSVKSSVPPRKANGDYLPTTIRGSKVTAYMPDSRQDAMFGSEENN